ncbi:hypothetical protein A3K78_11230 [Candidatus Bathyarchaeota archaeon RBG_13_52_12]|nr:MAG: hypothetical protein A3K78_11230 [Candidatus Bathyarchaeota archaeon RBG_13_52_12]
MSEFTTKSFNGFIAQGKLMGNRCKKCEALHIPPRQICSKCGSQQLEWYEFRGDGALAAVTVNRTPSSGFKGRCPYSVGIIRLVEGPSISGLMAFDEPEKFKVGTRVSFTVVKDGEKSILAFKII